MWAFVFALDLNFSGQKTISDGHPGYVVKLNFGKNFSVVELPLGNPTVSCKVLPDFKVWFESEKGEKDQNCLIPDKEQSDHIWGGLHTCPQFNVQEGWYLEIATTYPPALSRLSPPLRFGLARQKWRFAVAISKSHGSWTFNCGQVCCQSSGGKGLFSFGSKMRFLWYLRLLVNLLVSCKYSIDNIQQNADALQKGI